MYSRMSSSLIRFRLLKATNMPLAISNAHISGTLRHNDIRLLHVLEHPNGCRGCFRLDRPENTMKSPRTHPERTQPSDAVAFMQKLASDWLAQDQFAPIAEFNHAPNRLTPGVRIEAAIFWQVG
jgi:hypothetical protein